MNNNQERQRLEALFADLERLATDSVGKTPEISNQLESLRARMLELEKRFLESDETPNDVDVNSVENRQVIQQHSQGPILYEKDRMGYGYVDDRLESLQASAYEQPNLDNVATSLLTVGGQTIGEMQIEPAAERPLTQDDMDLANSIAQQAALQIQNLRLLASTERSRAEAETATRRFMHEGWDSYLDAINRNERIGYAYDQSAVTSYSDKLKINGDLHKPIMLMDEEVGALLLKPNPSRPISQDDQEMIDAVANQVSQQVENIRLLADASRARAEAEDAIRRLTRGNWETFTADREDSNLSFIYNSVDVSPLNESAMPQDIVLTQPLMVRGEAVGQLAVAGWKSVSPEALAMTASIAAQTSIHLETLRLSEELQKRAKYAHR